MTPAQAESIARERLPCRCAGKDQFLNEYHPKDCPAHYRPDVARALVEAATLPTRQQIAAILWAEQCRYHVKYGFKETDEFYYPRLRLMQADAILSSNKTRVEGEG